MIEVYYESKSYYNLYLEHVKLSPLLRTALSSANTLS